MISAFREPIPCVLVAVRPLAHASLTRLLDPLQTLKRPKELVVKIDLPRLVRVSTPAWPWLVVNASASAF